MNGKEIVQKCQLHQVLCQAHSNIAHKGRDKMDKYIKRNYESVSQEVIQPFVSLCSIHEEQKSITRRQKQPVLATIQARGFLTNLQMELMDLRNLPCACSCHRKHSWILHMTDHFTKYSWLYPLKSKQAEEVLECPSQFCWQFGFPQKIHTDNGREFTEEFSDVPILQEQPERYHSTSWSSQKTINSRFGGKEQSNSKAKHQKDLKRKETKSKSLVSVTRGSCLQKGHCGT